MSDDLEQYRKAFDAAKKAGNQKLMAQIANKLKGTAGSTQVDVRAAGNAAMDSQMPMYQGGLVSLGRGFNNLVQGARQIGGDIGEATGFMSPEENQALQERVHRSRAEGEGPWERMRERYGASMDVGEMVGETAPFLNLPVVRFGEAAGFIGRMAGRAAPEAAYGAAEASVPYVPEGESRAERATEGAGWAATTSGVTDYLAKRANARRNRFGDATDAEGARLEDIYATAKQEGIPVREGTLDDQMRAAESAAVSRTTGTGPGDTAEDIAGGLQKAMAERRGDSDTAYGMLFGALDADVGGNIRPSAEGIRASAIKMMQREAEQGGFADKDLMSELQKWSTIDDASLTFGDLHKWRSDLRARMRGLGPKSAAQAARFNDIEKMVTSHITRQAEELGPGMGQAIKNLDDWYYDNIGRIERIPQVKNQLGENPTPATFSNWLMGGAADPKKTEVFELLTPQGKQAIYEATWNNAFRKAKQGKAFNPLQYAKYLETNSEKLGKYFPDQADEFNNLAKVMRHIAGEGQTADNNILRMIRGFPFMYRAVGDAVRRSNFRYKLANAPADIRPGSPAMENFYRGLIRAAAIQDSDALGAATDNLGEVYREGEELYKSSMDEVAGRLFR